MHLQSFSRVNIHICNSIYTSTISCLVESRVKMSRTYIYTHIPSLDRLRKHTCTSPLLHTSERLPYKHAPLYATFVLTTSVWKVSLIENRVLQTVLWDIRGWNARFLEYRSAISRPFKLSVLTLAAFPIVHSYLLPYVFSQHFTLLRYVTVN